MQLHDLKRPAGLKRPYRRVGRGQSSTRGKQSGRGGKGQTARAGAKIRPALRDVIKKLPKRRGYGKNRGRTVVGTRPPAIAIPLSRLEALFDAGEVSMQMFVQKGIVKARRMTPVKIVGGGKLTKRFSLKGIPASASACEAIRAAGGSVA